MKTIIYIHGIGKSKKAHGYSKKFQEELGTQYEHVEFSWQEEVEEQIDMYFDEAFAKPKW